MPSKPQRPKIPDAGRRCGVCGRTQTTGEGLAGFRSMLALLRQQGVSLALPNAMHAHPSCIRQASQQANP